METPKWSASDAWDRMDLRRKRAESLTHLVMKTIEGHLHRDAKYGEVGRALMDLLTEQGVELMTDYHRQELGLPPRDDLGWTREEILAWELHRMELLTRPLPMFIMPAAEKP